VAKFVRHEPRIGAAKRNHGASVGLQQGLREDRCDAAPAARGQHNRILTNPLRTLPVQWPRGEDVAQTSLLAVGYFDDLVVRGEFEVDLSERIRQPGFRSCHCLARRLGKLARHGFHEAPEQACESIEFAGSQRTQAKGGGRTTKIRQAIVAVAANRE